jgi:hypothetical protein
MSNAIETLENAGEAVKNGVKHVTDTVGHDLGGRAPVQTEAAPGNPDDCGPTGCEVEEEPVPA